MNGIQKDNLKGNLTTGVEVLEHCSTFAGLGKDQLSEIAAVAAPHYFKKGKFIFHQGDLPDFFYIVQKGMVKTFKVSTFGKQIIVLV